MFFNLWLLFLTSFFYALVDKCDKYERKLTQKRVNGRFKNIIKSFFELVIFCFRYFQQWLVFFSILLFVKTYIHNIGKEVSDLINTFIVLALAFIIMLDWLEFSINLSRKFVIILILMFTLLGLFHSKWWAGISLLISIVGLAFSDEFISHFFTVEVTSKQKSFYKFLIPYTTLIFYISMVIVQEILPKKLIEWLYRVMQLFANSKETISEINLALLNGFLEVCIFCVIWWLLKILCKKLSPFNSIFFEELAYVEEKFKSKIKEISSLK